MFSREKVIETHLTTQISGADFERFGNLYLRYFYKNIFAQTKLGSQIGGSNTIAGQPDSYFSLPNHKFIFAEFTSQKKNLVSKLKKDLKSCLDEQAHGVEHDRIEHIDLVYAGRLKTAKSELEIAEPARKLGISVMFHDIDRLVNATVDDIRLAKALELQVDTGQILTTAEFIDHSERSRLTIGTPLSNDFLERAEFKQLTESFTTSDIVIIHGQPGCGKTKLAVEFLQHNINVYPQCEGYVVINQQPAIWDDVLNYFPDGKEYIILIDDANRQVENLLTVLNHFNRLRKSNFKILITVRKYALNEVRQSLLKHEYRFNELTLGNMTSEQISEILKTPSFNIHNGHYHYKINRLVNGNVRLAIMLATLTKKDGYDISILSDITELYDEYYQRVVPDQTVWMDTIRLKVLGLTAMLRVVDTTNPIEMEPILNSWE